MEDLALLLPVERSLDLFFLFFPPPSYKNHCKNNSAGLMVPAPPGGD